MCTNSFIADDNGNNIIELNTKIIANGYDYVLGIYLYKVVIFY